tara:strand:+ start:3084 stop:3710 length:627 start_codon:yes stop_codon:yes gene_type:complete
MSTLKATNLVHPTSSSNNIVLDNSGNVEARKVNGCQRIILEQFYTPCDGSVIALQDGNHTLSGPSAYYEVTDTFTDIAGSSFTYTPPTGTTQVIYDFMFAERNNGGSGPIISYKLLLDSDEVTKGRTVSRESSSYEGKVQIKWGFNIGGTADTTVGRVASWTSNKTIKIQCARYSSTFPALLHETSHWGAGGSDDSFVLPTLGITAIG